MQQIYLGLGGNEGDVFSRLQKALALLSLQPRIEDLKISQFYHTEPVQVDSPLWFINAVCSFRTSLSLQEIFNITQEIEIQLGKISKPKNASRPIDIDILFYGDLIYSDEALVIPHLHWKERLFVLMPLADLTPQVILQNGKEKELFVLKDLITALSKSGQRINLLEKNLDFQ